MAPAVTCTCGTCSKCKHRAYMRRYYRRNVARICEIARRSRARRIDAVRAYDRARGNHDTDRVKVRARKAVHRAVLRGDLKTAPCEVCGANTVQAHHDDYTRPLDVRWLCHFHHGLEHRRVAVTEEGTF